MNDRIEQIEARADAATEGPWKVVRHDLSLYVESRYANLQTNLGYVGNHPDNDADFIANAREDVPYLLALVREQQARLDKVARITASMDRIADFNIGVMGQRGDMGISLRQHAKDIRAALTASPETES